MIKKYSTEKTAHEELKEPLLDDKEHSDVEKFGIESEKDEELIAKATELELEPVVYLPSAPLVVCHFLEYLLHDGCSVGIDCHLAFFVQEFLV